MINRKNVLCFASFLCLFSVILLNTGCTTRRPVSRPDFTINLEGQSYDLLGRVVYKGKMHNLFGLFTWGGASYYKLYEKAKEMGADDVVNVSVDYETWHIGGLYNQRTYVMSGIAIKYKKN